MFFNLVLFRALLGIVGAIALVVAGAGGLAVPAVVAGPSAFVVDSTVDAVDETPGDGECATADGECTLRAAIQESNAVADVNTIELPEGEYSIPPGGPLEDDGATGDLDLREELSIVGAGREVTIIDGRDDDRLIDVHEGTAVEISGVTLRNGHARGMGGAILNSGSLTFADGEIIDSYASNNGGGIFNTGTLTVIGSSIRRNEAFTCGGICNETGGSLVVEDSVLLNNAAKFSGGALRNAGDTTITNSTIADNAAEIGGGIDSWAGIVRMTGSAIRGNNAVTCGGICNDGTGIVVLDDSTIFGNAAEFEAGGLGSDGEVTITGTTIWNNHADMAGGIGNRGSMTIVGSTIENNDAVSDSGGIGSDVGAFTEVTDSVIRGNTSATFAGIGNGGEFELRRSVVEDNVATVLAGGISNGGSMTVEATTIHGNSAEAAGAVVNGMAGDLTIVNSTISGNDATSSGALLNLGTATIKHSTIANNATTEGGAINASARLRLQHVLIGDNDGANCSGNGTFVSNGHNLEDEDSCGLNATGDLPNTAAAIGPLADNGGPTSGIGPIDGNGWPPRTHALLPTSAAIDAGGRLCVPVDQRGVVRPQGGACDIGAFELEAHLIPPPPELTPIEFPDVGTGSVGSSSGLTWLVALLAGLAVTAALSFVALRARVS